MFHVKPKHYIRTELTVPGVGTAIHVAELEEIDAQSCTMLRIIELAGDETIMGAAAGGVTEGQITAPSEVVPHPDTYADFPDITATRLDPEEFEGLYSEAAAKFPRLP
ncbi:hypothetical protein C3B44_11475 [Corynebacterium yudongzhengii]|uniref:Uncharacterized protein n=1 Tax=Corynebacterium yudongzhengii TaxID=2080740 RepID=A0A2U1T4P0_9CORY|nr:hypothetical protein [Corynebacterium yudongzhengii]AWB82870.1 hypothetical protein C3B44_11475 [Corynebacterium yudongzhengii]PWC00935.1 hypothetical protein DF222_10200 [Corynebacterium yudongzhengii]